MARVTHVKHARQRYEQKPARLDESGNPVKVPLTRSDGSPKMTRAKDGRPARPILITPMVDDRSKPLPMPKCGKCGVEIKPGDPYKHMTPRSGPYGGRRLNRCATCPTWQVWEYSSSWSARIDRAVHDAESMLDGADFASVEDAESVRDDVATSIRELAEEKEQAADNLEEGFGHETSQSEEIRDEADQLNNWADEIEGADIPEIEVEEVDCDDDEFHNEDREHGDDDECDQCGGSVGSPGTYTPEEPTEEQIDEWREQARQAIQEVLDNRPF